MDLLEPFRPSNPQRDLDKKRASHAKLVAQLVSAETDIVASEAETRRLSSAGADNAAIDAAKANEHTCVARRDARRVAVADSDKEIIELEIDVADAADQKQRAATIIELKAMTGEFEDAGKALCAGLEKMTAIAGRLAPFIPESGALANYCKGSATEIPAAIDLVLKLIGYHSASVVNHDAPATLRKPEPTYVAPASVQPALTQLFLLTDAVWTDSRGQQRVLAKHHDCELTAEQARRALRKGWACVMDDVRRKQLRNQAMGRHPEVRFCMNFDLDEDASGAAIDPILASPALPTSQFTPIDRGPPVQLRVATRQIP
jgi:hypothetical protein